MTKSLTVPKLGAAKRQLETVIRMYFNGEDPVSMHTLAAAAYNIVRDVNEKRGGEPMLVKGKFFDYINPQHHKHLREKLNQAENFFKHADRDHDATLAFNPGYTESFIMDACSKYTELTGEYPPFFRIFNGWFMMNHHNLLTLPEDQANILKEGAKIFVPTGRSAFFSEMLPDVMNSGV